jgi:four helix bundle protein
MAQALDRPEPRQPTVSTCHNPELARLDVYRVAVEFQRVVAQLLSRPRLGALRDQLDRADASVALNIAEGAGRFAPADKARHYLIARGSALECLAIVDLFEARGMIGPAGLRHGRGLLDRIAGMLTRRARSQQDRARTR